MIMLWCSEISLNPSIVIEFFIISCRWNHWKCDQHQQCHNHRPPVPGQCAAVPGWTVGDRQCCFLCCQGKLLFKILSQFIGVIITSFFMLSLSFLMNLIIIFNNKIYFIFICTFFRGLKFHLWLPAMGWISWETRPSRRCSFWRTSKPASTKLSTGKLTELSVSFIIKDLSTCINFIRPR